MDFIQWMKKSNLSISGVAKKFDISRITVRKIMKKERSFKKTINKLITDTRFTELPITKSMFQTKEKTKKKEVKCSCVECRQ